VTALSSDFTFAHLEVLSYNHNHLEVLKRILLKHDSRVGFLFKELQISDVLLVFTFFGLVFPLVVFFLLVLHVCGRCFECLHKRSHEDSQDYA
jgi:hypothetical protein